MNKEVLVALIAKDVNELQMLTEGLEEMQNIPTPYLRLALEKSKALTVNVENLINYLDSKFEEDKLEAQRQAELEAKQAEEAAKEAELARIAEEQEALLRAQELERERQAEERRKAEAEMARQAAAIEAARQAELAEKRRQEEEERRKEELRRQEEERRRVEEQSIAPIVPIETTTSTASIVDTVAENQVPTVADSIETAESLGDKLAKNADDTLASALNNKKIVDLKASITLGDRFRYQRELFGGNGEKMNKALSDFNAFETMDEAQSYISKNFDWALDSEVVSDFIQLLQRRYL